MTPPRANGTALNLMASTNRARAEPAKPYSQTSGRTDEVQLSFQSSSVPRKSTARSPSA